MKKQFLQFLGVIVITICISCKKSADKGPYQIRGYTGGYQFGGMVDGVEFLPKGTFDFGSTIPPISATYWAPSGPGNPSGDLFVRISSYKYLGTNLTLNQIEFNVRDFSGVGVYKLNKLTSPYGYVGRPDNYGGYLSDTALRPRKYFLTNNFGDSGVVECLKWNSDEFHFAFKFTARNSVVGDPDRNAKTIEGVLTWKR